MAVSHQILHWLEAGNTITAKEAVERFGITQLPKAIWDMRNAGYDVRSDWVRETIDGRTVRYSRYYLHDGGDGD